MRWIGRENIGRAGAAFTSFLPDRTFTSNAGEQVVLPIAAHIKEAGAASRVVVLADTFGWDALGASCFLRTDFAR